MRAAMLNAIIARLGRNVTDATLFVSVMSKGPQVRQSRKNLQKRRMNNFEKKVVFAVLVVTNNIVFTYVI